MSYAWWAVTGLALAGIGWHEVAEHHLLRRVFRRPVTPSAHHGMWTGLEPSQRRAIHTEMVLLAGLSAAAAALYPGITLALASVATAAAAWSAMFRPGHHPHEPARTPWQGSADEG